MQPFKSPIDGLSPRLADKASVRITVEPGDNTCGFNSGERAEVMGMLDANGKVVNEADSIGKTIFYGFSIYVPIGFKAATQTGYPWGIVFQLHGPDGSFNSGNYNASPDFAFGIEAGVSAQTTRSVNPSITTCPVAEAFSNRSGNSVVAYVAGYNADDVSDRGPRGGSKKPTNCYFSSDPFPTFGKWTDFVIAVRWAGTPSGGITVYRRDIGTKGFKTVLHLTDIATLSYNNVVDGSSATNIKGTHYWKHGLYRAVSDHRDTIYLSGISRGMSFEDVEAASFETHDGMP
jgi:hypothetical protein